MNIKKIAITTMAATVLAMAAPMTGVLPDPLGVTASAAEVKLVTGTIDTAISQKLINNDFVNLGKGYYILLNSVTDEWGEKTSSVNKVVRIGDKEIEQWRSTGKLEPTTVQCDVNLSGMGLISGNLNNGSYVTFAQTLAGTEASHYYILKLDEAGGKLTKAYDFVYKQDGDFFNQAFCLPSGYAFCGYQYRDFSFDYMYTPTGEKIEVKMPEDAREWEFTDGAGKYIAYASTGANAVINGETNKIYGICRNGDVEELATRPNVILGLTGKYNYAVYTYYSNETNGFIDLIYSSADEKLYDIKRADGELCYDVNGSTVTFGGRGYYRLIDLNGKELSKKYALMATEDGGKTYLVQSADGKQWGYIDSTGKELAMFDDASDFRGNGLYAPVVKDGKGWLVDKNMNQVSEKIDAVGCVTFGDELFRFVTAKDSEGNATADVWVTASANGSSSTTTPSEPSKPTVPTKQQSFHDDKTDISVDGKFPEGTVLKTEAKQTSDNRVSWDITPVDANGNKAQPEGNATVKLPIPETFKGKTVYVYRVENGKYTALESTVEGNYIVFKTPHFSEYLLTTEKVEAAASNPATGFSAAAALGVVALAGAFVIVSKKKR